MTHPSHRGNDVAEDRTANDNELLWGGPPAVMIAEGIQRLIGRLNGALRRYPTVAEIDDHIYGRTAGPKIAEAIISAAEVFRQDVGRYPTPAEVLAGLLLVDTETALLTYVANDIRVDDRVMWAECDENGQALHQTLDGRDDMIVPAYGTVIAQPEGWHGDNIITRDDGDSVVIGRKWLIKVLG